jgi:heme oxygenase (biliverdin-IX-beta and delta-forming)
MSRHAGPGGEAGPPPPPEPSYPERARTLVYLARAGALSTLSRRHPGHPFGSVMPYAVDERGAPLLLISTMAMHTQNLEADRRASLLVTQPGWTEDPLAGGRATLMGHAARVPAPGRPAVREAYLARHPRAASWVDFEDFSFWRLEVTDVYFVGGFAAMDWITSEGYAAARPDPLADAAEDILAHMNRDHADALLTLARAHADAGAEEAIMLSVDRLGFRVRIKSGERLHAARLAFPREVTTGEECRAALIEMIGRARR